MHYLCFCVASLVIPIQLPWGVVNSVQIYTHKLKFISGFCPTLIYPHLLWPLVFNRQRSGTTYNGGVLPVLICGGLKRGICLLTADDRYRCQYPGFIPHGHELQAEHLTPPHMLVHPYITPSIYHFWWFYASFLCLIFLFSLRLFLCPSRRSPHPFPFLPSVPSPSSSLLPAGCEDAKTHANHGWHIIEGSGLFAVSSVFGS